MPQTADGSLVPHFRVDDALHSHPKARQAGLEAMGLWNLCGSYCMGYLTDGFVPEWYVKSWPRGAALAKRLVAAKLWTPAVNDDGDKGWQFHEFTGPGRNDSRAEVEASRKRWRDKKAGQRAESPRVSPKVSPGDTADENPRFDPLSDENQPQETRYKGRDKGVKPAPNDSQNNPTQNAPTSTSTEMSPGDKPGDSLRVTRDPTQPNPIENYSPTEESSPNVGADERGLSEPVEPSASRLVAALIPDTIPAAVRTGLRIRASELMRADGLDSDTVSETLRRWLTRPGAGVGLLPSLAADVIRERAAPNSSPPASKLRTVAELAARQRATENAHPATTPKEIQR